MTKLTGKDYELLSAYLDGELATKERTRLEAQLRSQPELHEALLQMRRTRQLLRAAPRLRPRRNFTLTEKMVGLHQTRRGGLNLFSLFGYASAMATLALVVTVVFSLLPGGAGLPIASAPAAVELQEMAVTQQVEQAPAPEAPASLAQEAPPDASAKSAAAPEATLTGLPEPTPTPDMGVMLAPPPGMGGARDNGVGGGGGAGEEGSEENAFPPQEFPTPTPSAEGTAVAAVEAATEELNDLQMNAEPAAELAQGQGEPAEDTQSEQFVWFSPLRIVQLSLAGVALLTGLAALVLRRKGRI